MKYLKICIVVFLFTADQITKILVQKYFGLHESRHVLGDIVQFTYLRNMGGAFGLKFFGPTFLTVTTTLIIIILFFLYFSKRLRPAKLWAEFSFLMIMGGALGNLYCRWFRGGVIDFIDVGVGKLRWPIFNVADIWITIGIFVLIIYYSFFADEEERKFV